MIDNSLLTGAVSILFVGSILFPIIFPRSRFIRYLAFVLVPAFLVFSFILSIFLGQPTLEFNWFTIKDINFKIAINFGTVELSICAVVFIILTFVQMVYIQLEFRQRDTKQLKTQILLNIFSAIMSFTVLSDNIFQFLVGLELLGAISAIMVGMEDNSSKESTRIFVFNKFSSLIFLLAVIFIIMHLGDPSFSVIRKAYESIAYHSELIFPGYLLLLACLCKGAQIPFSIWIIDSTKANIYVSVMLHAATVVGIGVIFVAKCYYIFEALSWAQNIMLVVGILTAVLMGFSSVYHFNIKKIIAASTASTVGFMFVASGYSEYSIALLYFICHAFYKAVFFLSFAYVIHVSCKESNILNMGGLNKFIPNITDMVWISFLTTIGFPFFVSFFAKIALLSSLFYTSKFIMSLLVVASNIILIISSFRLIMISLYGSVRMEESVLSRVTDLTDSRLSTPWVFITCSVFGSFFAWSMYEWQVLHFGMFGMVYSRDFFEYLIENLIEIVQIAIGILFVLNYISVESKIENTFTKIFKNHFISEYLSIGFYRLVRGLLWLIAFINESINLLIDTISIYFVNFSSDFLSKTFKSRISIQMCWIFLGTIFCIGYLILRWKIYA